MGREEIGKEERGKERTVGNDRVLSNKIRRREKGERRRDLGLQPIIHQVKNIHSKLIWRPKTIHRERSRYDVFFFFGNATYSLLKQN